MKSLESEIEFSMAAPKAIAPLSLIGFPTIYNQIYKYIDRISGDYNYFG